MQNLKFLLAFFALTTLIASCDKDDDNGTEQELITTVQLSFADVLGGTTLSFEAKDLDGDGGDPPVIEDITLDANTPYSLSITFLDESDAAHTHNITEEVEAESTAHLVCYDATGDVSAPVASDLDSDGQDLGLFASFSTGAAGSGTLKVTLKHEPDKLATDPCATGETDVEVTFNVTIQ